MGGEVPGGAAAAADPRGRMRGPDGDDEDAEYDPFAEEPAPQVIADRQATSKAAPRGAQAKAGDLATAPTSSKAPSLSAKAPPKGSQPKSAGGACATATSKAGAPFAEPKSGPRAPPPPKAAAAGDGADESRSKSTTAKPPSAVAAALPRTATAKRPPPLGSLAKSSGVPPPLPMDLPPGPPPGPPPPAELMTAPPGPPPEPGIGPPALSAPQPLPLPPALPLPSAGPLPLPSALPLPGGFDPALLAPGPMLLGGPLVEWEAHPSPHGVPYYFCKATGESRWVLPTGPFHRIVPAPVAGAAPTAAIAGPAQAPVAAPAGGDVAKGKLGEPESWETIGKTGWLRVETDKGFTYFFHKKKKKTSWTCPPEIAREVAELDGVLGIAPAGAAEPEKAPSGGGAVAEVPEVGEAKEDAAKPKAPKADREKIRKDKEAEQKASEEKRRFLNFKQLLLEKGVRSFDKYEKWMPKLLHDARWTAVPNAERKPLFAAYAKRIDSDRQKMEAEKKRGGREGFRELLKEAQDNGLFTDRTGVQVVRALEKKYGEDKRWLAVPERERERTIGEVAEELAQHKKKQLEKANFEFRQLCTEKLRGQDKDLPPFRKLEKALRADPRWAPVACTADRERLYGQVLRELETARRERQKRQRQDKEEVERARKIKRMTAAEEGLVNLLAERVKAPDATTWEQVREVLADLPELRDCKLESDEQERIFADYRQSILDQRCQAFISHLANVPMDIAGPEMEFEEVFAAALDDSSAKFFAGMPEDVLRGAWQEWRIKALDRAADNALAWLRSCGHLAGCEAVEQGTPEFEQLVAKLRAADIRFRRLNDRPGVQASLLAERLTELRENRARGRGGADMDDDD